MKTSSDRITRKAARLALLQSGYLLESRVEAYLRRHWGYVEANATYEDPEAGKSREYDVYAMKAFQAGPTDDDWLFGVLLIECINNTQPLPIITKEPQVPFLHRNEIKLSGLPVRMPFKSHKGWIGLADYLQMEKYHHYCQSRIGTQFCSFVTKKAGQKEEWMATH